MQVRLRVSAIFITNRSHVAVPLACSASDRAPRSDHRRRLTSPSNRRPPSRQPITATTAVQSRLGMKLVVAGIIATFTSVANAASFHGSTARRGGFNLAPLTARASTCNGDTSLCDKKYSNVTFIGSHNSYAISGENGTSISLPNFRSSPRRQLTGLVSRC